MGLRVGAFNVKGPPAGGLGGREEVMEGADGLALGLSVPATSGEANDCGSVLERLKCRNAFRHGFDRIQPSIKRMAAFAIFLNLN